MTVTCAINSLVLSFYRIKMLSPILSWEITYSNPCRKLIIEVHLDSNFVVLVH